MTNREFWENKLMHYCTIFRNVKSGYITYDKLGDGRVYRVHKKLNRCVKTATYITMREALNQICRHHYDCSFYL